MTKILQRIDTPANWVSVNPVLGKGEVGWETGTRKQKVGDGVTAWNALSYVSPAVTKADVGLGNVDNTNDLNKPISTATQNALNAKAPLASPTFTGDPKAPTPAATDNDTSIATTAFVRGRVDPVASAVDLKAPLDSPLFTGDPRVPTPAPTDNDTSIPTTAWVNSRVTERRLAIGGFNWGSAPTNGASAGWLRYNTALTVEGETYFIEAGGTSAPANSYIKINQAGWYQINAAVFFGTGSVSGANRRGVGLGVGTNDTSLPAYSLQQVLSWASNASGSMTVSGMLYLAAGDFLSLYRYTDVANTYAPSIGNIRLSRCA